MKLDSAPLIETVMEQKLPLKALQAMQCFA
jgi:hypothetical protein